VIGNDTLLPVQRIWVSGDDQIWLNLRLHLGLHCHWHRSDDVAVIGNRANRLANRAFLPRPLLNDREEPLLASQGEILSWSRNRN
jgi:hypothetical protein